jgi:hypothetical protein
MQEAAAKMEFVEAAILKLYQLCFYICVWLSIQDVILSIEVANNHIFFPEYQWQKLGLHIPIFIFGEIVDVASIDILDGLIIQMC